jgi:hypothetical protein
MASASIRSVAKAGPGSFPIRDADLVLVEKPGELGSPTWGGAQASVLSSSENKAVVDETRRIFNTADEALQATAIGKEATMCTALRDLVVDVLGYDKRVWW